MSFKIGDRVKAVDEEFHGTVVGVGPGEKVRAEDEHGFSHTFLDKELVRIDHQRDDLMLEGLPSPKPSVMVPEEKKPDSRGEWVVDLHIEELIDSHLGMSNSEIMQVQLSRFKDFMLRAERSGVRRFIVIHGVGEGVLKAAIRRLVHQKGDYEVLDADPRRYGYGATEVLQRR